MRQEDVPEPSHALENIGEVFDITRRVDKPVSVRMLDEITVRAERFLRIKATVKHIRIKEQRETGHRLFQARVVTALGADRTHGAGKQRLVGLMQTLVTLRLDSHRGKLADLLKTAGRQLPAGVAVDAGRVDKEVARHIAVETFFGVRHRLSVHLRSLSLIHI